MKRNKRIILGFCLFFLFSLTGCVTTPIDSTNQELLWCGAKPCNDKPKTDEAGCSLPAGAYYQECKTNNDCPKNQSCREIECYTDSTPSQVKACL
jgi:hypothetical protein